MSRNNSANNNVAESRNQPQRSQNQQQGQQQQSHQKQKQQQSQSTQQAMGPDSRSLVEAIKPLAMVLCTAGKQSRPGGMFKLV